MTLSVSGLGSAEGRRKIAEIGDAPFIAGRALQADRTLDDPTHRICDVRVELRRIGGR